jgi:hypothetical protein
MSSRVTSNLTDFGSVFAYPDTGRSIDVVQVGAAPAALPTPRMMRPQAHPQVQANNHVTLAFPRFTAKSPKTYPGSNCAFQSMHRFGKIADKGLWILAAAAQ